MPKNRDDVNVLDDQPELLVGPEVNGKLAYGVVLPFYVSLYIHDKVLHNAMFDSGASHNLMPKAVMEKLNLDITRPYKDLFSFDSSQVKCLGLIKDLHVSLVQYLNKKVLMDMVVADIPPKYSMLYQDLGEPSSKDLCSWTSLMPLFQYLGNQRDCIGKHRLNMW